MRKPSRPWTPTTAVGWNWTNSRSASAAPAARASSRPEPNEPGGLVVRDHSAAAPPVARIVPRAVERAAVLEPRRRRTRPSAAQARGARALEDLDRRVLGDVGGELAQDPAAGRAAAGVHDAAGAVAALEAEREVAVAVGVEAHAERLEVVEAGGRLVASGPRRRERRTSPRPALERVLAGAAPGSRRRRAPPRARPGPSRTRSRRAGAPRRAPPARPRGPRTGRRTARPRPRRRRRGRSARRSRKAVRYRRACALAAPRRLARARHPGPSRAARADPRAGGRDGPPRLVRRRAAGGAGRSTATLLQTVHPESLRGGARGAVRARRRVPRRRHRGGAGRRSRRRCARPAARWRWSTRCSAGRRSAGVSALRPPGHHAEPSGRWGSASSATWRWRRGGRTSRARRRAGADPRLGRAPRQRDRGDLRRRLRRAVRLDPRVAAVSGHRPGVVRRRRARGRGTRSTCRCPAGSGDAVVPLAGRARGGAADRARGSRSSCSSRRASTPTATTRSPRARSPRPGFAGDDRVAAARRATRSARRSGWCWRAATTSARWRARWRR